MHLTSNIKRTFRLTSSIKFFRIFFEHTHPQEYRVPEIGELGVLNISREMFVGGDRFPAGPR